MLVKSKLQIANCKLQIANCGAAHSNPQSAIRNPQSKRNGLSLTEVLIAMGILTIGLLSVAAVFPVGSLYMQKAEIADRGSAIAQSVMNDLVSRGMLNPRAWYTMVPTPPGAKGSAIWNAQFDADSFLFGSPKPGTFTRPFAAALSEALTQSGVATDKTILAKQFGHAFVIDPLAAAVMTYPSGQAHPQVAYQVPASIFPASAYLEYFQYAKYPSNSTTAWLPWTGGLAVPEKMTWPVHRITFRQISSGLPLDRQMAEFYFRANDDLAYDLPARDDRPAMQRVDVSGITVLARQWTGDYSWIVTVAPTTNAARDGMATNPEGYAYDVSVVVFYKRPLPDTQESAWAQFGANPRNPSAMGMNERVVKAVVQSTGLNGGELLLTDWPDVTDANNKAVSAFDQLRTGQWVFLCGPHPNSSVSEPRLASNWYQVLAVDSTGTGISNFNPATQRVVSLRGPQWPWQPPTSYNSPEASNNLCVGIFRGAVAVHSKTMRLEGKSSAWSVPSGGTGGGSSADGGFGSGGSTATEPPKYIP
jgi:hypothetical protein